MTAHLTISRPRAAHAIVVGCLTAVLGLAACSSSGGGGGNTSGSTPGGSSSSMSMSMPAGASMPAGSDTGDAGGGSGGTDGVSSDKIVIKGFAYSGHLTVKPGEKVSIVNEDSAAHTVTAKQDKAFDSGTIAGNGGTGSITAPTKPGTYPFGCNFHPNMAGTLTVQG